MAIVKYKDSRNGRIYVYESKGVWDPEHHQSRPVRTYLGRWDPETQTIINTTRTKKSGEKEKEKAERLSLDDRLLERIRVLEEEITSLKKENSSMRRALAQIHEQSADF